MNINKQVVDQLSRWFVRRDKDTTFGGHLLPSAESTYNIGSSDRRVNVLYARAVVADNLGTTEGGGIGNADTVDGYDASSTPTASTLLPLDGSAQFPTSVYPNALLVDGSRALTGNLSVNAGITIDGVDIGAHASNADAHHSRSHGITSSSDHTVTGSTQQLVGLTGTNTLGLLTPSSSPGASSQILKSDTDGRLRLEELGLGNSPSAYYKLYAVQSKTSPGVGVGGIYSQAVISDVATYYGSGLFLLEQAQTASNNSLTMTNLLARYVHNTTYNHTGAIYNLVSETYSYSTGDISNVYDIVAGAGYDQYSSTILGNRFGVLVQDSSFSISGAQYGLYVSSLTKGVDNYAILTNNGYVKFGDNVAIVGSPSEYTGLYIVREGSGASAVHVYGEHIFAYSTDHQDAYSLTALYAQAYFQDTSSSSVGLVGGEISVFHSTGSTLTSAIGVQTNAYLYSSGEISNWYGFFVGGSFLPSGGSVEYRRGLFVAQPATGVVNNYAIQIEDQRNASGFTYAIYSGGGDIHFAYGDMTLNDIDIETSNYVSQTTGWAIGYDGSADFRSLYSDEIVTKAFIAEVYESLVGAIIVTKSRAKLSRSFTVPFGTEIVGISSSLTGVSIVAVDTGSEYFSISGDHTSEIAVGDKFTVAGSTGNDGIWTVASTSYVDPNTRIFVSGDITDATVDGTISFHHYFSIDGNHTAKFSVSDTIYINYSTGNDGSYTVESTYYDSGNDETDIYPTTAIPVLTVDGNLGKGSTIYLQDLEGLEGTQVFSANDFVELRVIDTSGGGLIMVNAWGSVSNYTDLTGGEQSWLFEAVYSESGYGLTVNSGSLVLDYGQPSSGSRGVVEITVLDSAGSPYSQVKTWETNPYNPANWTTHLREGNLDGISGIDLEYGLWAGQGTGATDTWILLSDQSAEIHNMPLKINDGSNNTILLEPSTPYFSIGSTAPTSYSSGSGIWMGKDSGAFKFRVGNPSGIRFAWDGTDVYVGGSAEYVKVSSSGLSLYGNSTEVIKLDTSGNAIFGQVATDQGNMYWNVTTKQLQFRGDTSGTVVKAYIDTDGSLSVGEGTLKFDHLGETITTPGRVFEGLVTEIDSDPIGGIYMDYNSDAVDGDVVSRFWFDRGEYGTEQITNGTFESGLTGWTFTETGDTSYTQSSVSKVGDYSMYLTASYDLGISDIVAKSNSITATTGDRFIITFYYRTSLTGTSLDHGTISVYSYGAGVSGVINYLPIQPTGRWRYVHVVTPPCPSGTTSAELRLRVASGYSGTVGIYFDQVSVKKITYYSSILLDQTSIEMYNDVGINYGDFYVRNGGLSVGSSTAPDEGSVLYTGNLVSMPAGFGGTEYDVYAYYALTTKSVHTSWDGDSKSTGESTVSLTSTWTITVPSYAKAIQIRMRVESATAGASVSVGNSTDKYQMTLFAPASSTSVPSGGNGIITLDNTNIYVNVAGATCNVYIWILGWFI